MEGEIMVVSRKKAKGKARRAYTKFVAKTTTFVDSISEIPFRTEYN
jgi:hypothetical protein